MAQNKAPPYTLKFYAVILFLAGTALVLFSIFARHIYEYGQGNLTFRFLSWLADPATYEQLLRELGFALMVACFVTFGAEILLRNMQIRERRLESVR